MVEVTGRRGAPIRPQSAVRFVGRNALAAKCRHRIAHGILPTCAAYGCAILTATHKQNEKGTLADALFVLVEVTGFEPAASTSRT